MRRIRILVLKTTHVPFVAVIWAYESSQQFISNRAHSLPVSTIPFTPARPLSANQVNVARLSGIPTAAAKSAFSLANTTPSKNVQGEFGGVPRTPSAGSSAEVGLIELVQRLSSQVDELTSMVAAQKAD